jgi:hypothetical protein
VGDDGGAAIDAAEPDAIQFDCEPDTIVCDDENDRYVECGSDGSPTRVINCALGCSDGVEKCIDVAPSNGLAGFLDLARDDAASTDVVFTGTSTINTDTGAVTIGGVATTVPTDVANGIRVYMFKSVEIPGTLKVSGSLSLALVSDGDVTITGVLDVSADGLTGGPGSISDFNDPCVGGDMVGGVDFPGGGGGGRFQPGANGGFAYPNISGAPGGIALTDPDLQPLIGGCRGGESRGLMTPVPPPNGGGGGGAVQIVSRSIISLLGGGIIDASGGGGVSTGFGPGGGSGGAVLLEAPALTLDGAGVIVSTKGGAGGGPSGSALDAPGEDGGTDAAPAAGGANSGYAAGGDGGTASAAPEAGDAGNSTNKLGAGGGGSVGEARFNNESASVTPANGAAIRSRFSVGSIGTRLVP